MSKKLLSRNDTYGGSDKSNECMVLGSILREQGIFASLCSHWSTGGKNLKGGKYLDSVTTMKPDSISAIQLGRKSTGQSQDARSRDEGKPGSIKSCTKTCKCKFWLDNWCATCTDVTLCVCVLLDGWDYEWISRKNNCKSVTIYFFRLRPQAYEKLENMKVQFCDLVVNTRKSYFYKK